MNIIIQNNSVIKTAMEAINFEEALPMLILFTVIISSIRIFYLIRHKKPFVLYKELFFLMFLLYILTLFHIVTFQDNNYGTHNFIPFKEILRYKIGTSGFLKNVVGNIVLFIPFGIFVSTILKVKKIWLPLFLSLLATFTIEMIQLKIGGRTFDIDDIILNILGGLLGYYLYHSLSAIIEKLPKFMKSSVFLNTLIIIIFVLMILYFSGVYKSFLGGVS